MKWIILLILLGLLGGSWYQFDKAGKQLVALEQKIDDEKNLGDPEGTVSKLESEKQGFEGQRLFMGILLTFFCAGVTGIVVVAYLLPFFAQRVTHAVYDSAEVVEKDAMHEARSLIAKGDYDGAVSAFQRAIVEDPSNRLPWVEIMKIQKDHLGDPAASIQTIRQALESQAWEINDAAFFLFRLAELYDQAQGDRASAIAILNQVVEQFPGTRHSANASHQIQEWSGSAVRTEEADFLARLRGGSPGAGQS